MISEGIEVPMGFQQIFIMSPNEILTHRYHWLVKKKNQYGKRDTWEILFGWQVLAGRKKPKKNNDQLIKAKHLVITHAPEEDNWMNWP